MQRTFFTPPDLVHCCGGISSIVQCRARRSTKAGNVTVQDWQVQCDRETFEKCRGDARFVYIVTLARAVNALRFVHSAMIHAGEGNAPEAMRARLNSYLFATAILYEGIKLVHEHFHPVCFALFDLYDLVEVGFRVSFPDFYVALHDLVIRRIDIFV
jgi:hypothetical protein